MEEWITKAILNYYDVISKFRDEAERNKPRKPEVYVNRVIGEVFGQFDNFLISKVLAKYSYLYEEEEKLRLLKEAEEREAEIERNAYLRLAAGKKKKAAPTTSKSAIIIPSSNSSTSSTSMPLLPNQIMSSPLTGSAASTSSTQDDQISILGKSISEKIDFCYRAISSQYAKIFARSSTCLLLCKVSFIYHSSSAKG